MGSGEAIAPPDSFINPVVKYLMFVFNFIFWLIGVLFICVGTWAYIQKEQFDYGKAQTEIDSVIDIVFDLTLLCIIIGCIIWVIAFPGCLGALRENVILLKIFSYTLSALFIMEIILAVLAFIFSSDLKQKLTDILSVEALVRYRDDPDLRNLIDWFQKTFDCCGVGPHSYKDWSMNIYFNCTDDNLSPEACAVPYSCCRKPNDIEVIENYINTNCGYGMQKLGSIEANEKIYTTGCIQGVVNLAEDNLYLMGGVALGFALPQLLSIFLSQVLVRQIRKQMGDY